ncbi:MAG: hypothetical protein Pg6C_17760 [Treponemataceae bacterium]|nr:MAG: hypothetical protein Pg6C_17760 [Treponemataceae bacterium]
MSKYYQKEILGMLYVYEDEQWTAAALMACRILESVLRLHAEEDLNASETSNPTAERRGCWFYREIAVVKLIFMGLKKIAEKWTMPIRDWGAALNQFAVIYGEDRVPL